MTEIIVAFLRREITEAKEVLHYAGFSYELMQNWDYRTVKALRHRYKLGERAINEIRLQKAAMAYQRIATARTLAIGLDIPLADIGLSES